MLTEYSVEHKIFLLNCDTTATHKTVWMWPPYLISALIISIELIEIIFPCLVENSRSKYRRIRNCRISQLVLIIQCSVSTYPKELEVKLLAWLPWKTLLNSLTSTQLKTLSQWTFHLQEGYLGFQVTGMMEWSQKSRPKKIPTASSKTPKNPKFSIRWLVKGYQDCPFKVEKGEIFTAVKKVGDYGRAFKVVNFERGQVGHLQRDVVSMLCSLTYEFMWSKVT